jgi:class 3 adenylate cyclase
VAWWAQILRFGASPGEAVRFEQMWRDTDVRAVLPSVQVPALVVFRGNEAEPARRTAAAIARAELVLLPPGDAAPIGDATEPFAGAVEAFLARVRDEEAALDRVLATALFTDIVDSSATAAALGDRAWRELLEKHHATIRSLLDRFGGREVDTAGDGFFAAFDGPTRAVKCAQAIVGAMRSLGIEIRAGIHTGEVETIAGKAGGIAVVIGARVGAAARPMEVWVSSTVKDLTAGSGLVFEDAGEHELKGVPDRWRLYRVVG